MICSALIFNYHIHFNASYSIAIVYEAVGAAVGAGVTIVAAPAVLG